MSTFVNCVNCMKQEAITPKFLGLLSRHLWVCWSHILFCFNFHHLFIYLIYFFVGFSEKLSPWLQPVLSIFSVVSGEHHVS
jgi:hypothetical protein